MTPAETHELLVDQFGEGILAIEDIPAEPYILVAPQKLAEVAEFLASEPTLKFDSLMCLSGVEPDAKGSDELWVVYHLHSFSQGHKLALKVSVPKEDPHVPTVEHVWKTANWHEREAYDLYGIIFDGHSDLKRILLPDDWEGHPLRKDYEEPEFYRDMRVPY